MIIIYFATIAFLIGNGLFMLADPVSWYHSVPGVVDTGPLNTHFVRDIGVIYAIAGMALLWRLLDVRAWPAALAGASFLLIHAALHILELASGHGHQVYPGDIPGIYGVAVLAVWLALPDRNPFAGMAWSLRGILHNRINAFEREFNYDASYLHQMAEASPRAAIRFNGIQGMAKHREDVPVDAWYAASLVAARQEDCGPCIQLVTDMALSEGVDATQLAAVVSDSPARMNDDVALAYRFARASLAHDAEAMPLRDIVVERWGQPGMVSLAMTIASSRVFPTLKYAMGHGHTCTRVMIDGQDALTAAAAG